MTFEKPKRDSVINVHVRVEFARVGEIDTMNEKYQAEINVEAKWASQDNFTTYDPKVNWNPKLYIENAIQEPKDAARYTVSSEAGATVITEVRNIKGAFWEKLELQNFPFDVQELSVTVASRLSCEDVKLIPLESNGKIGFRATRTFVDQQKWRLFKMVKISNEPSYFKTKHEIIKINPLEPEEEEPPEYPKIVASCFCSRKAGYYLFNAFFLIFLITLTTFTSFAIDSKLPQNRIPATCTFLLTSVSFKWVINRSLPTVSYLTSLDLYSILCIFFICLLATWHAIVGSNWTKDEAKEIDKWAVISFGILFVLLNVYFLIRLLISYIPIFKLSKEEHEYIKKNK
ncbi:unnamed protein product [Brachionus calyciflorus]|uniref:Neurotransmitter-gated ion-channel ligand-binding domain-containing protein n=1 Tax=Brachionus calyciflorus TaxID=104777 RepID=A0A813W994_9BILA|nr:unnamed protein product [Brachionus calyciflorus]